MKQTIIEQVGRIKHMMGLNEEDHGNMFDSFPPDILKLLEDNYAHMYMHNYDWNTMADKFMDRGDEFKEWREKKKVDEFIKNKSKIISAIRADLITLKRRKQAELKLKAYEDLIVPLLGNHITGKALTKFQEDIILDPNATPASIQRGFEEAMNVLDKYGRVDPRKVEPSTVFPGGEVNLPTFESFVEENPKYMSTFKIWKALMDHAAELSIKDLNAYRIYNNYKGLRELYDFLTSDKKTTNTEHENS